MFDPQKPQMTASWGTPWLVREHTIFLAIFFLKFYQNFLGGRIFWGSFWGSLSVRVMMIVKLCLDLVE